jgi:hypothetical protein
MIDPKQIPDEVIKAAISAYDYASSDVYTTAEQDMAETIVAALNAWPGVDYRPTFGPSRIILPLPQEKVDD